MAIGDLLHQTPVTTPDPYTGCPVTRLTPPDHTSHHMYFYNRMVTSDSSRLLYCAEINGRRNLYLMELATGDAVQLTEGDALDDYGAMISADDKSVYYQQDRKVWKLDLATLQRTCLYAAPDGWDCGNWGMSDDNRYLVMTETRRDTLPDLTGKKGWEFFPLTCAAKPLCHIVYLDTQTGEHHIVVEDRCWFGHAQLRPGDYESDFTAQLDALYQEISSRPGFSYDPASDAAFQSYAATAAGTAVPGPSPRMSSSPTSSGCPPATVWPTSTARRTTAAPRPSG